QEELGAAPPTPWTVVQSRPEVAKRGDQRRHAYAHHVACLPDEQGDIVWRLGGVDIEGIALLFSALRCGRALGFQFFENGLCDRLDQRVELILRYGRRWCRGLSSGLAPDDGDEHQDHNCRESS